MKIIDRIDNILNEASKEIDETSGTELEMYIENDSQLYSQQFIPIVKNLMTKRAQGKYDSKKAVKLFMYLMESGAKKYVKDFGGTWNIMFNKPTREWTAKRFVENFDNEAEIGGYDEYIPKKYQKKAKK
jgi:hypothetical protein